MNEIYDEENKFADRKKAEFYETYNSQRIFEAEYGMGVYTPDELSGLIKRLRDRRAAINHDLVCLGYDPLSDEF